MVNSMTGYGRSEQEMGLQKVLIEMKAVNHRYCDIVLKIPKKMAMFEDRIKKLVKSHVKRGRVEIYMSFEEEKGEDFTVKPNYAVLDQYKAALDEMKDRYGITRDFDLNLLTRFQDVFSVEYKEIDEEKVWALIESAAKDALDSLTQMRQVEGQKLLDDIQGRIQTIKAIIVELEKRAPEIVVIHKEKMRERISELLGEIELDEAKLAQEVAYFSDKTNITEELVRLDSHLDQLAGIFNEDQSIGRKLDFLLQEINREINTIGSKSPDVDISNHVIELKSEFEKIREQIQNIE
ncbi:YicC family protein [Acidaminobacter sp. JC074]|uniref:YicC/YloC family endoribonuclease n=1 Tax=Acidaminobacter sp. JC074 TaxID=2530199 RepID=UPI001F10F77F|nr:YicC/YloC family endoribonuclease [Acidaminobacter sp. JC074]MCH4890253.1 YicC family protein [Acidaminobacter sp. JC074]